MRDWPVIDEPELLARLALGWEEFVAFITGFLAAIGPREYGPERLDRALRYPWERPARSYVLRGTEVQLLDELGAAEREAEIAAFTAGRHPILAFGSNAAPKTLGLKFAHFEAPDDRAVLVLAGQLHDLDVGAAAGPTVYGALPATLFSSPGTAVRAAVLWLTPAQVTQITWSELTYRFGRFDTASFTPDESDVEIGGGLFGYVSRFGTFCPDGEPVAMAAIPASGRRAPALTQEGLLDTAARLVFGPQARAETLVRAIFEDPRAVLTRAEPVLWPLGRPLPDEHWTPFRP